MQCGNGKNWIMKRTPKEYCTEKHKEKRIEKRQRDKLSTSRPDPTTRGKEPLFPLNRRLSKPQKRSVGFGDEKNFDCDRIRTSNRAARCLDVHKSLTNVFAC